MAAPYTGSKSMTSGSNAILLVLKPCTNSPRKEKSQNHISNATNRTSHSMYICFLNI